MYSYSLFQAEIEETLKRIQSHKGVTGIIVVNQEGKIAPVKVTLYVIVNPGPAEPRYALPLQTVNIQIS